MNQRKSLKNNEKRRNTFQKMASDNFNWRNWSQGRLVRRSSEYIKSNQKKAFLIRPSQNNHKGFDRNTKKEINDLKLLEGEIQAKKRN